MATWQDVLAKGDIIAHDDVIGVAVTYSKKSGFCQPTSKESTLSYNSGLQWVLSQHIPGRGEFWRTAFVGGNQNATDGPDIHQPE